MSFSERELWTVIHGMAFGAIYLIGFGGGLAEFWSLRPEWQTVEGLQKRIKRLKIGTLSMAIFAWLTVLTGTYIVYPWYRAKPPADLTILTDYPRSYLLATPGMAAWHRFGMEWKEHIAWLCVILCTAVAYIVFRYGTKLSEHTRVRHAAALLFSIAFATAGVAGLLGAFINKVAPLR